MACRATRPRVNRHGLWLGTSLAAAGRGLALPCALALLGVLALGCSDSEKEAGGPPTVSGFERDGNFVNFRFAHTRGVYSLTCERGTELTKASGEPWVDETPVCGSGAYYLDGVRHENQPELDCVPCSNSFCVAFGSESSISVGERFLAGVVSVSDAGADAGADGSGDGDAAPGADGGTGVDFPALETRPYLGPYQIIVRYRLDSSCAGDLVESAPLSIQLPASP